MLAISDETLKGMNAFGTIDAANVVGAVATELAFGLAANSAIRLVTMSLISTTSLFASTTAVACSLYCGTYRIGDADRRERDLWRPDE